jgi:ribosome-associated protein
MSPIVQGAKRKALAIAAASLDKKAEDVVVLDVTKLTSIADYLVLCSAGSERQVRAIADHLTSCLIDQHVYPLSVEGLTASQWVLIDYGDVIVHIFRSDIRAHYALERLWMDAEQIPIPNCPPTPVSVGTPPIQTQPARLGG